MIVKQTDDLKLKLRDVKHEKISKSQVHSSSGESAAGCLSSAEYGQCYPVNMCQAGLTYKLYDWGPWQNKCPNPECGATGTLRVQNSGGGVMGIVCDKCGVDHDPVGGYGTSVYIGGREEGNAPTGTGTPACKNRLYPCSGSSGTSSGTQVTTGTVASTDTTTETTDSTSTESTDSSTSEETTEEPGTIEEELKAICAYKDYHMCVTQHKEVYIQSKYPPKKPEFVVEKWMMKKDSFSYAVKPEPTDTVMPTTVKVTYNNGTVEVYFNELRDLFGRGTPITDKQSKMNKSQAVEHGKKLLMEALREKTIEISFTMLLTGNINVGSWIQVPNPRGTSKNIYWVDNINLSLDPDSTHNMTVNCLYMPKKEETESSGGGTSDLSGLEAIGKAEAKFDDVQGQSDPDVMEKVGYGDCWADALWLYRKLSAANIQCQIMGYQNKEGDRHAWIRYNSGGSWVDFPYTKWGGKHHGDCCGGTPFVLVPAGQSNVTVQTLISKGY